jgi:hypothetical protein
MLLLLGQALAQDLPEVPDAQILAAQVATTCGNPYSLVELAFTFVVEVEGEERTRRRHVWRPRDGTLTVSEGDATTTLTQL